MDNKVKVRCIAVPGRFFLLTVIGMVVSLLSGIAIREASLSMMQYFLHYALMFIGCICFVKAVGLVHAYEKRED